MRDLRLGALVLFAVCATACTSFPTKAKEEFAKEFSCPEDQVQVNDRKDLNAQAVHDRKRLKATPPAEVAADPTRLAKWNKDQADLEASRAGLYSGYDVFEVSGCNHHNLMLCHRPSGKGNSGTVTCSMETVL